jgi:hypothetical protein
MLISVRLWREKLELHGLFLAKKLSGIMVRAGLWVPKQRAARILNHGTGVRVLVS